MVGIGQEETRRKQKNDSRITQQWRVETVKGSRISAVEDAIKHKQTSMPKVTRM